MSWYLPWRIRVTSNLEYWLKMMTSRLSVNYHCPCPSSGTHYKNSQLATYLQSLPSSIYFYLSDEPYVQDWVCHL
jgi:hypothetical protein